MHPLPPPVKCAWASAVAQMDLRTVDAVAYYQHLALGRRTSLEQRRVVLTTRLFTPDLATRLRALLTRHDLELFTQLAAGYSSALTPNEINYPWQWPGAWPALTTLRPLERLLALGLVVAVRQPPPLTLLLPTEMVDLVSALRHRPPSVPQSLPLLTTLAAWPDDAVTALTTLLVGPTPHTPAGRWPGPLLRRLHATEQPALLGAAERRTRWHRLHTVLHSAGLLAVEAGHCTPTLAVPLFMALPPSEQLQRLLTAWTTAPLTPAELPAGIGPDDFDGPALWAWLAPRLHELGTATYRLDAVLDHWAAAGEPLLVAPLWRAPPPQAAPSPAGAALLRALLRGPLRHFGLVHGDTSWVAVTPPAHAWLGGAPALPPPGDPPHLDGPTLWLPRLGAAALRWQVAPWAELQAIDAVGYTYQFTPASLRRGGLRYGSVTPLRALLRPLASTLPPALTTLLAQARRPPALTLTSAALLQTADPALLTDLLDRRAIRHHLGPRLGPHAALVRHPEPLRARLVRAGLLDPQATPPVLPLLAPAADTEILILALRRAAANTPPFAPLFARRAAALATTLPSDRRAALDDLCLALEPAADEEQLPPGAPPQSALDRHALRHALRAALAGGHRLRLRYYTAGRHAVGWRTVQPLALHPPYLFAYDPHVQDERCFRLDRILALTGDPLGPPPEDQVDRAPPPTDPPATLALDYGERPPSE